MSLDFTNHNRTYIRLQKISTTLTCLSICTHTVHMDSQTSCERSLVYRHQGSCVYSKYKACCQPTLLPRILVPGDSHLGTDCFAWCDFPSGLHAQCTFEAKPKCCLLLPYQAFLGLCLTSPPTELSFLQSAGNYEMPSTPGCMFRSWACHSTQ